MEGSSRGSSWRWEWPWSPAWAAIPPPPWCGSPGTGPSWPLIGQRRAPMLGSYWSAPVPGGTAQAGHFAQEPIVQDPEMWHLVKTRSWKPGCLAFKVSGSLYIMYHSHLAEVHVHLSPDACKLLHQVSGAQSLMSWGIFSLRMIHAANKFLLCDARSAVDCWKQRQVTSHALSCDWLGSLAADTHPTKTTLSWQKKECNQIQNSEWRLRPMWF